jgi:hypothetical protein
LLQAYPGLVQEQWLGARFNYAGGMGMQIQEVRQLRNHYLLAYLDTETLKTNPTVLISLLEHKSRHPPQDWAPFDIREYHTYWGQGRFGVKYHGDAVVMQGPHYGTLQPWDRRKVHRSESVGFSHPRLVIEAQALLLGFLRKVGELCARTYLRKVQDHP